MERPARMTTLALKAKQEPTFYLVVTGGGSWGGGTPFRTYRAGVHEISAEIADTVLAFKRKHGGIPWLVVSDERPEIEDGSLIGPLLPQDLRPGALPDGVRLVEHDQEDESNMDERSPDLPEPPPLVYACQYCTARFPSAAAAKRHLRHRHLLQHEKVEARVRAQLEAAAAERATTEQLDDAALSAEGVENLHPAEREPLDVDSRLPAPASPQDFLGSL